MKSTKGRIENPLAKKVNMKKLKAGHAKTLAQSGLHEPKSPLGR